MNGMILAFSKWDTDKHGLHRFKTFKHCKSVKIRENLCPIFKIAKLLL
jgi:hypothetical protein